MTPTKHRNHLSDLRGASRLAIDATRGLADLVEAMHHSISRAPGLLAKAPPGRTRGITGLVYRSVHGVTRLVGGSIDAVLGRLAPLVGHVEPSPAREAIVAALNGVLGDHLAETGNPLAIAFGFRRNGKALTLERGALAAAIPACTGKLLVLAHGLCLDDRQWNRRGHDHGAALARDLGYTPVYLHYNSGLHISTNGRQLADALETLLAQWPVPLTEFALVAHSMGGLVARSACHYGAARGTRVAAAARRARVSRHAASRRADGARRQLDRHAARHQSVHRAVRAAGEDPQRGHHRPPLRQSRRRGLAGARPLRARRSPALRAAAATACAAMPSARRPAASRAVAPGPLPGDGLVPLASALGQHDNPELALNIPPSRQWIAHDCGHLDLLDRADGIQADPAVARRGAGAHGRVTRRTAPIR